ncbi:macrolide family glycosyltransferase [Clostridium luticellarii]|jgi:MGT family glycosyltransferase|uniref:Oleandomycin glycosyltransferase n=1 Tax=Clostridium luticellarii TaxID=1691940 RepID=A0A2T0B4R2_9CLOT|nr:macrolide family glycosyltransferase [Clostridium luticellarii]MCI1946178.1 glycosyl transferase [Clostridium luticellarii]MCI1969261.1 glycosyl transferase [Clostridium luticellarii]MCI1996951.1 glycosyl transferase [Clostridium luticellarii]MCI2040852.1 glycosyl transferase [Clostridium luticellarii]PRR78869.1 Oleandomycin glycosyltransferase [Clostridium luticellarii]
MSKMLFISLPGHGHVNPTLGLVSELVRRGEKVTYYLTKDFQRKIEAAGAEFIEYKGGIDLFSIGNLLNSDQYIDAVEILNIVKDFEIIIDTILQQKGKYDYLVYDLFFPFGEEIGRSLGIPTICSITTFALNEKMRDEMVGGSMNRFKDMASIKGGFIRLKEIIALRVGFRRFMEIMNENKELYDYIKKMEEKYEFGLSGIGSLGIQKAMLNIVYTSRYFQAYVEKFDESYKFVGPSIVPREENTEIDTHIAKDQGIVYISLGTLFNNSIEFYQSCTEAFRGFDLQFIMSVGNNINIGQLGNIPDNFTVRNFVPQLEILKHADAFITHGGMNSVSEGLYYGIPLILIPQSVDQPMVARRVVELGAGISLDKDEVTQRLLQSTLNNILSDASYRKNSQIIGESLKNAGGYKKAADEIFQLEQRMLLKK